MKSRAEILHMASIENGVPIWGCIPGSPAAKAGLRYGDILLRVNDQRVRSIDDFISIVSERMEPFEVVVRRDAELLVFVLDPRLLVSQELDDEFEQVAHAVAEGRYFAPGAHREPLPN